MSGTEDQSPRMTPGQVVRNQGSSGTATIVLDGVGAPVVRTRRVADKQPGLADKVFNWGLLASGITVLVLLAAIGIFLFAQSRHAFAAEGLSFFGRVGFDALSSPPRVGVLGLLVGTCVVATIAVLVAVPLAILAALFITEYAPPGARRLLQGVIDLLAAVPSLLFGLWGFLFLAKQITPLSAWLASHFGFIPIFRVGSGASLVGSYFIAGIVVAMMVLPITASVVREVFAQTPPAEKEAAFALGSTRWGMVRTVVIPFGRGGMIGGAMLGLGRALGETIAVALLLPQVPTLMVHILQNGGSTIAGYIAENAGAPPFATSALLAAGLVLFVLTLVVNMGASVVVARSRSGAGVDL